MGGYIDISNLLGTLIGAFFGFLFGLYAQYLWGNKNRDENMRYIAKIFHNELKDNYDWAKKEGFELKNAQLETVFYIQLKTGGWQLMMGNPGLRHMPKDILEVISGAYTTLFDFNSLNDKINQARMLDREHFNIGYLRKNRNQLFGEMKKAVKIAYEKLEEEYPELSLG